VAIDPGGERLERRESRRLSGTAYSATRSAIIRCSPTATAPVAESRECDFGISSGWGRLAAVARMAVLHPTVPEGIELIFGDRQKLSQSEIGFLDQLVLAHFRRGSGAGDPAVVKDIDVIGELEALVGVLLDEDDRLPALGQAPKN
jgi:hypothetical protein